MKKRCLILLGLLGSWFTGCQQSPYMHAHLELLNAEKRALEDELYDLGFDYEDVCRELDRLKQQNQRLRGGDAPSRGAVESSRGSSSTNDTKPDLTPPMIDEGMLVDPRIELPSGPETREIPVPKSNTTPGTRAPRPPALPPRNPTNDQSGKSSPPPENATRTRSLEPADPRVTHIVLNQVLTGGSDFDRKPGDDGVVVVFEPRNRDDAFVPLAGPVSIVVLDPAKTAEEGRVVARWDVDANEAQKLLRNSSSIRGIELRLPWPAPAPQTDRLHLHVRYMTLDNRDLRADRPLFIKLPGQFTQQWTPRATSRVAVAGHVEKISPSFAPFQPAAPAQVSAISTAESPAAERAEDQPEQSAELSEGLPAIPPSDIARPEWRPNR